MQKKKPNVIVFFSDQQRWDTCGCYGQKIDTTPNLDKMAQRGTLFRNAFTCQPVCGPARACIQTGKHALETHCYRNGIALQKGEKTIANYFNDAGYQTAYVGKWHLASTDGEADIDIGEKFDYTVDAIPEHLRGGYKDFWVASDVLEFTSHGYGGYMWDKDNNKREFTHYRVDATCDFALEFLDGAKKDEPFFLMVSFIEPHHQNDRQRYEGPDGSKEKYKDYMLPEDLKGKDGDYAENYPDYLGCINSLDTNLGRVFDKLEELGIADDTVVIYTSDHGSHFKTRNGEYKRSCHEACVRIPMVACGPGFDGAGEKEQLVSLIDLAPTVLSIAGVEHPDYMVGLELSKIASGEEQKVRDAVFMQISESQIGRAIRTDRYKYSVKAPDKDSWKNSSSDVYVEDFLYDLENDPHEQNNLVSNSEYKDIRANLKEKLIEMMVEAGESVPEIKCKE